MKEFGFEIVLVFFNISYEEHNVRPFHWHQTKLSLVGSLRKWSRESGRKLCYSYGSSVHLRGQALIG